ncbi:hypothetical protein [Actinomadura harenae]|nr:hypothetical protein [Actinomadura harenae]
MSDQPLSVVEAAAWAPAARALVVELAARGLVARVLGHGAVRARNPAGEPAPDDLVGAALSPGLNQEVWCRPDWPDRELWWFWAWSGPNRDDPPELEHLCPVSETGLAADAIARVLAVPFTNAEVP